MAGKVHCEKAQDPRRRSVLGRLARGALGAATMVGPLRVLNVEPDAELAPEADPGEDSIYTPRKPSPKM